MTWTAPPVDRERPPHVASERAMLEAWLTFHRRTLLSKCTGLTAEQLRMRSVEPSTMSLLGLVRHMAEVERWWFRRNFAGDTEVGDLYVSDANPDGEFDDVGSADAEADLATFAAECTASDAAAAGHGLDATFVRPGHDQVNSLRWVYVHMIEEYARHNGHADLLRERVDGTTGW
jgi:uncharacterized damage-inducible protein DinB